MLKLTTSLTVVSHILIVTGKRKECAKDPKDIYITPMAVGRVVWQICLHLGVDAAGSISIYSIQHQHTLLASGSTQTSTKTITTRLSHGTELQRADTDMERVDM